MTDVRLEELKPEDNFSGHVDQGAIMAAVERHLGAQPGEGVVALIVRDAATNTSTLVVVLAERGDYTPLPSVLGAMFWQGMEPARAQARAEAFFLRWHAGAPDAAEGGIASEDDDLVRAVRQRQAAENEAALRQQRPEGLRNVKRITVAGRQIL